MATKKTAPFPKKSKSDNSTPATPSPKKTAMKKSGAKGLPSKYC